MYQCQLGANLYTRMYVYQIVVNGPWKAACLKYGAVFSFAKASPVLDRPCVYKVLEDFGLVEQGRENNLFHGLICSSTSQVSKGALVGEEGEGEGENTHSR